MMCYTKTGERRNFLVWVSLKIIPSSRRLSESNLLSVLSVKIVTSSSLSPAARLQEERVLHEAKLAKMEAEMKMVFQQKVQEKEAKLKQSEEELYARHKEMKDALDKQRADLEEKKRRVEQGRPITPDKGQVC
jgi:septin family protein